MVLVQCERSWRRELLPDCVRVDAVAVGDEVGSEFHPTVGRLAQGACRSVVAVSGCLSGEGVEGEDLDVGSVVGPGIIEDGYEAFVGASDVVGIVHRCEQAVAECSLLSASRGAMPRRRCLECGPRRRELSERTQHAPEMHAGECGHSRVAGRFSFVDRQLEGGSAGLVVAGLALGAPETGRLVRLCLKEAETSRSFHCAAEVNHGVVEAMLEAGEFAEHCIATSVEPRIVDSLQPMIDVFAGFDAAAPISRRDRGSGSEELVRGLVPSAVQPGIQSAAEIGELQGAVELAVVRHDVGEVVAAAGLQIDVIDGSSELGGRRDVVAGMCEVSG